MGHGEKVKYFLGPLNMVCLIIEIYWSEVETILKYNKIVLNVTFKKSPISIISTNILFCFQLNRMENGNKDSSSEANLKNSKTSRGSCFLDLEVFFFVKLFEFYLVTQSF